MTVQEVINHLSSLPAEDRSLPVFVAIGEAYTDAEFVYLNLDPRPGHWGAAVYIGPRFPGPVVYISPPRDKPDQ